MEQAIIQLRFQTESNSINADTLVKVMKDYIALIKDSNQIIDRLPLVIEVNSFSKGSFIVDFALKLKKGFSHQNLAAIGSLATAIGVAFQIFGSSDPQLAIKIENGTTTPVINQEIVYNIQNDNSVNKNITNIYKTIIQDKHIYGLDVYVDGVQQDSVSLEDMSELIPVSYTHLTLPTKA